jgi:serine/threonine-protein kinase
MGEVYRARDLRLEREVALKVLPAESLSDEKARARLVREARFAAKLNHPNICTVYQVGEADGRVFIAMELVSGEALNEHLSKHQIGADEVMRLGHEMADALAHAHASGVVHRDFKSGNVVITPGGSAKVLDFGLAGRLGDNELSEATTCTLDSLELPGKIVGTLAYMAPEQLRGKAADARSDIWALGVVLYEMASGVRPFRGGTGFELSSEILSATPEPLPPGPSGELPAQLQAVIDRCLQKEPDRRYRSASEVRAALEARQSVSNVQPAGWQAWKSRRPTKSRISPSGRRRTIRMAVLPFANLTGDPEQEYLSDGVTQEMISQLGRVRPQALSVIARSSVLRYRGGETPIDQIGRDLQIDYVLEGSARCEKNLVRITAELIQVEDQTVLWADAYERELAGILKLQSEVAQEVAEALTLELLPGEQARSISARSVDPDAYDAYLKGSYDWKQATPTRLEAAERYFELALERDPSYAPAYEGLAYVWVARQQMGMTPPREAGRRAKAAALRAISLDGCSAEAHEALALVKMYTDWDWEGADLEFRSSLEIAPNSASAYIYYAHYLMIVGQTEEAFRHSSRALELDPFNALFHSLHSMVLYGSRRFDDAMGAVHSALSIQPDNPVAWNTLLQLQSSLGMLDELVVARRQRLAHDPGLVEAFEQGLADSGYRGAHRRLADLLAARYQSSGGGDAFEVARRYVDASEYDTSVDWLEKAFEARDPNLPYVPVLPFYDPLRSNPRFQELVRRMNLATAALSPNPP